MKKAKTVDGCLFQTRFDVGFVELASMPVSNSIRRHFEFVLLGEIIQNLNLRY